MSIDNFSKQPSHWLIMLCSGLLIASHSYGVLANESMDSITESTNEPNEQAVVTDEMEQVEHNHNQHLHAHDHLPGADDVDNNAASVIPTDSTNVTGKQAEMEHSATDSEPATKKQAEHPEKAISVGKPLQSANILAFDGDRILFVGDSQSGRIFAYETMAGNNPHSDRSYNLSDLSSRIEDLLKLEPGDYIIRDMAIHPASKEAYIALTIIKNAGYQPRIIVTNQGGEMRMLDLADQHTVLSLPQAPVENFMFYDKSNGQMLTFTDMEFHEGKLYVSGLASDGFKSAIRVADYPFNGESTLTTVAIYHPAHNQKETQAPIRTLSIAKLNGKDHLVAAYTGTPLVTIPLDVLKDGAQVMGKTIAELGYGNTPLDMIPFTGRDDEAQPFPAILLTHKNRHANVLPLTGIATAEALTTPSPYEPAGFTGYSAPLAGLSQVADQDEKRIAALRRHADYGRLELVSFIKNVFFRMTDLESEYDMPGYVYDERQQQDMRPVKARLMKEEGYPMQPIP